MLNALWISLLGLGSSPSGHNKAVEPGGYEYDETSNVENTEHQSINLFPPIKATPSIKMEILREFLESSTIHGLSYIPSSKVKPIPIYILSLML